MTKAFSTIWQNRDLIYRMTIKDINDRYAGSNLGLLWSMIGPLFLVAIYSLTFTFIFQVKIGTGKPVEYALYAICALVPWIVMQEALVKTTSSLLSNTNLVKQVIFPIDILPVNAVFNSFPTIIFGFTLYIIIFAIFLTHQLSLMFLFLPVVIFFQVLFSIGIGWLLAALGVYFRDLREIINVSLLVFMFITPVLYLESMLPKALIWPIKFNPFTHLINMYRDIFFYGQIQHPWSFIIFGLLAILTFYLGYYFFQKVKSFFANVL